MRTISGCLLSMLLVSAAHAAEGAPTAKPRLAVMDVKVEGAELDPVVGESLSAVLAAELQLRAGDRYEILSRGDVQRLLQEQVERMKGGGEGAQDVVEKVTNVDFTVSCSVSKLGEEYVLSLELLDNRSATIASRQKVTYLGRPGGLVELLRPYVARLIDGTRAEEYRGGLEVLTAEGGAQVLLGDRQLGPTPLRPLTDLPIGRHRLQLVKDGFLPFTADVVVNRNETAVFQATLVDEASLQPWYRKWWVWTAAGAGAAAVATAMVLILGGEEPARVVFDEPLPD